jgi:uncharacterized protein YcfL
MKEKILMLLTMISVICLSAFTPSKEMNTTSAIAVMKTRPTVTISYPSEFTRFINLQQKKAVLKASRKTKTLAPYFTYYWWDFNGGVTNQPDPYYYSADLDNWPDCTLFTGNTYCEIKAQPDMYDYTIPDLGTINAIRYRPLQ